MLSYKKLVGLLLSLLLSFSSPASNEKVYTVATVSNDYVSYEVFDMISENLGLSFRFINFPMFKDAFKALESGEIDFMQGVTATEKRAEFFDFTKPIVADYGFLFTKPGDSFNENSHTLAVPKGTVLSGLMPSRLNNVTAYEYSTLKEAKSLIDSNKVDAVITYLYDLQKMLAYELEPHVLSNYISLKPASIASKKNVHLDILSIIENYTDSPEFQMEIKSRIVKYQKKLIAASLRSKLIKSDIDISKPIRIMLDSSYNKRFVENFGDKTKFKGIFGEISFEACLILNLNCGFFSNVLNIEDKELFSNFGRKTVDIVGPVEITESNQEKFYFSKSVYKQKLILVKRSGYKNNVYNSLSALFLENIGVVDGTYGEQKILDFFASERVSKYKSLDQLFAALVNKKVDYALMTQSDFYEKLTGSHDSYSIVEETSLGDLDYYDLGLAFPKTEQGYALSQFFSFAIELNDEYEVVAKYDIPPTWQENLLWQKKLRSISVVGFIVVGLFLFLSIYFFYYKSTTDELTKLKNRLAIYKKYGKTFPRGQALVYLDINKFKFINDTFGHAMGDRTLILLADRIKMYWKGQAYRIGGDEFVLVCKENSQVIEQMLAKMSPFKLMDEELSIEHEVTLSVGVVEMLDQEMPLDSVLNNADKQMYRSKSRFRQSNRS